MSTAAQWRGSFLVPVSADSAERTVEVKRKTVLRRGDRETEDLYNMIAELYRSYHTDEHESLWVSSRKGEIRLRLIGRNRSELPPKRKYVSVDLEDFE
jgi:hypothetical protein